ncbi:MAG: CHAT domain-containing protein [Elusimicrobiota bacterium]|jgi:tetratricopeptide (TPR) repeat protein
MRTVVFALLWPLLCAAAPLAGAASPRDQVLGRLAEAEAVSKLPRADRERLAKERGASLAEVDLDLQRKSVRLCEEAAALARKTGDRGLLGRALEKLGLRTYWDATQPAKAAALAEEALDSYRVAKDTEGAQRVLMSLPKILMITRDFRKAVRYGEEAYASDAAAAKEGARTALHLDLGNAYLGQGDLPKAQEHFERLLADLRERGWWKGSIPDILKQLADIRLRSGDLRGAAGFLEQVRYDTDGKNEKARIQSRYNQGLVDSRLGELYLDLRDYRKALEYAEKFDKYTKPLKLARVYSRLGEYGKAVASVTEFDSWIRDQFKLFGEAKAKEMFDAKYLVENSLSLGQLFAELGDYQKAAAYHEEAVRFARGSQWAGEGMTKAYRGLGSIHYEAGAFDKAREFLGKALKAEGLLGLPTRETELRIADAMLAQGRLPAAEAAYRKFDDSLGLGRLLLEKRDFAAARAAFERALRSAEGTREARALFAANVGLGHAVAGLKDFPAAAASYRKALELSETQREGLGPAERALFFSAKVSGFGRTEPYEGLARCLAAQGDAAGAFYWSESLKGRLLAEAIAQAGKGSGFSLPAELAAQQESLESRIRGLRTEMEALFRGGQMELHGLRESELREAKGELDRFVSGLRKTHPEYAAIRYPAPLRPGEVKLSNREVLLAFEMTDDKSFLFVLEGASMTLRARELPLPGREVERLVLRYRDSFEGVASAADLLRFKAKEGQRLHEILFGDVLKSLPRDASVIIVPDETLGLLPFESLPVTLPEVEKAGDGEHGPFPIGISYVGDLFPVSYAQSAASLTFLRSLAKAVPAGSGALAVVDPVFSLADARAASAPKAENEPMRLMGVIRGWERMGAAGTRQRGAARPAGSAPEPAGEEVFPRLAKTAEIGAEFRRLFGGAATVLEGAEAAEDRVASFPFSDQRYVVFGTHGILDNDIPYIREPALVLAQAGNPAGKDGFLTMSEVMGLKIPAEVVALTACRTGVGRRLSGEGVLGMGRAFQHAGAANVLMSLWSVEEGATVALTGAFFRHVKDGKPSGEALRLARADIRRQGYEHPFYWSAFVLVSR